MFRKVSVVGVRAVAIAIFLTVACGPGRMVSTALAQEQRCVTPAFVLEKAQLPLVSRLEGDELIAFNKNYENQFHLKAPDNDLVLVYGTDNMTEWYLVSFKAGCAMFAPVGIEPAVFKQIKDGKPS